MKNQFTGYYQPTQEEYTKLWHEALVVLDTNVLLSLYKLPVSVRDEILGVLDKLKTRLWIPHHVALEFQKGRLTVIANERKSVDEALTSTSDLINEVKNKFDALQIDKRDIGVDCNALMKELDKAGKQIVEAIKKTHESQLDISALDPIRERIDALIEEKVGLGPSTQNELDNLAIDGESRFENKVPPGYKDVDKNKNPADATFIFDGLKYQRKFGDLIIWRQLISHVKESNTKSVLFITADNKEDWWWREQGKTIGPRQELVREICRDGGVELFWMYSSVQFVEQANKYVSAKVSKESVAELQNMLADTEKNRRVFISHSSVDNYDNELIDSKQRYFSDPRNIEELIGNWLRKRGDLVEATQGFPDFVVKRNSGYHGFEVKLLNRIDKITSHPILTDILRRASLDISINRLNSFTLIVVVPEKNFVDISLTYGDRQELSLMLRDLLVKYPVESIVVGAIIDYNFMILFNETSGGFSGDYSYAMSS